MAPNPRKIEVEEVRDSDFILAEYVSPNKASHPVLGLAVFSQPLPGIRMRRVSEGWAIDYGYHAGGEQFLVHRRDIEVGRGRFKDVEKPVSFRPPLRWSSPPPEPRPLREPGPPPQIEPPEWLPERKAFRLEDLPGITTSVARMLRADGVDSREKLLALGEQGLQRYKGIGPARAKVIISSVEKTE